MLSFGFDISSISAIVVSKQYIEYFHNPAGALQGAIGSGMSAGSVVGSALCGVISDKLGRRDSIFFATFFWLIGTAVQVSTNSSGMLIAGRVLNGFTVGITSSQVPVYLAEIAKAESRGSIIIIQQLAVEFGILIMYFLGYGCTFIEGPASFRAAWAMQFIPAVLLMAGLPFLPRSPRWLAKVGQEKEAVNTLARIHAKGDTNDPLVIAEWEEIVTTMQAEREAAPGWRKFVLRGMWKRTLAGFSVQAWQQLAGANTIVCKSTGLPLVFLLEGGFTVPSSAPPGPTIFPDHDRPQGSKVPGMIILTRKHHGLTDTCLRLSYVYRSYGRFDRQRRYDHVWNPICHLHRLYRLDYAFRRQFRSSHTAYLRSLGNGPLPLCCWRYYGYTLHLCPRRCR